MEARSIVNARLIISSFALFILMITGVYALGDSTGTGMTLTGTGLSLTPVDPVVFIDGEARLWDYTALTQNTATIYGVPSTNVHGYSGTLLPLRQHYAFTGETLQYFVVVMDGNGIADIASVDLIIDNGVPTNIGSCAPVAGFLVDSGFKLVDYSGAPTAYDPAIMASYVCTLTVNAGWVGQYDIFVQVQDSLGAIAQGIEVDHFYFNPTIDVQIVGGPISFGSVAQGTTAMSSTVRLKNMEVGANVADSAVLLDMYISSDQYFDDPIDPLAACPTINGLPYDALSYYATKGSINSGTNNNDYPGVSTLVAPSCEANIDGFTPLVFENTNDVTNMCRIINWDFTSSILAQGAEMSITFKADVPTPCTGTFTNGQFYFVGEVI